MTKWHFWYALSNLNRTFGFCIAACFWPKERTSATNHATWGCCSFPVLDGTLFDQWYRETIGIVCNLLFVQVTTENLSDVQRIIGIFRKQCPSGLIVAYQPGKTGDEPLLSGDIFAIFHELPVPGQAWEFVSQVEEHLAPVSQA